MSLRMTCLLNDLCTVGGVLDGHGILSGDCDGAGIPFKLDDLSETLTPALYLCQQLLLELDAACTGEVEMCIERDGWQLAQPLHMIREFQNSFSSFTGWSVNQLLKGYVALSNADVVA